MGLGFFGKVPAKRDFVSRHIPRSVLQPYENWLHACLAHSQNQMGNEWARYYLVAPIWRFWLGSKILGVPCQGIIMSSVDQVGRYFPFTILHYADEAVKTCPPVLDDQKQWFACAEREALRVLSDEDFELETITSDLSNPHLRGMASGASAYMDSDGTNWLPAQEPVQGSSSEADASSQTDRNNGEMACCDDVASDLSVSQAEGLLAKPGDLSEETELVQAKPEKCPETAQPQNEQKTRILHQKESAGLFESVGQAEFCDAAASRSYWWVVQSDKVVALRCQNGLPNPRFYMQMIGAVSFHPQS